MVRLNCSFCLWGWPLQEVAFCTGHNFRNIGCLERYADRGAIARALAKRRLRGVENFIPRQRSFTALQRP